MNTRNTRSPTLDPRTHVMQLAAALRPHRARPRPARCVSALLFRVGVLLPGLVHRRLLVTMQLGFEKLHGRVEGPGALLQLALHDPLFAWLQPLTREITQLDELSTGQVDAAALEEARTSVGRLFGQESEFRASYLACLQADADVVVAHGAVQSLV